MTKSFTKPLLDSLPFSLGTEKTQGSGFFSNDEQNLFAWVNGIATKQHDDPPHVRVGSCQKGMNLYLVFKRIAFAAMLLEADLDFAYDAHLGYITSCPSRLGTGMQIEIELKVPYSLSDNHLKIEEEFDVEFT